MTHIVSNDQGGGFEWTAAGNPTVRGATAVSLDTEGKIRSLNVCWDGSLLDDAEISTLTSLAIEPRR